MEIIREYCREFGIEEKIKEDRTQYKLKLENSAEKENSSKNTFTFDKIRKEFPNAYEKWTETDDQLLEVSFKMDQDINELAKLFQRKPGAIRSRLKKIGLIE